MKRKENGKLLALRDGLTIHAPESGALAHKYGLVGDTSGWHHATVWCDPNTGAVHLRPQNGSTESQYVGRVLPRGRFSEAVSPAIVNVASRQRAARLELARAGVAEFCNGQENGFGLTFLGWTRCKRCSRMLSAGTSIVDSMGPTCAGKGPRTDRAQRKQAGLAAMAALIAKGKGR